MSLESIMRRVYPKEENCMACRLCEVGCTVEHSKSKDVLEAYLVEKPRVFAHTSVEVEPTESFSRQCRHCVDAPCVDACMNGAMHKDPITGAIRINQDKCVGCWMCIMTCPYGVIKPDIENKKVASKCDLCVESGFPECVANCPNEAIILVDEKGEKVDSK